MRKLIFIIAMLTGLIGRGQISDALIQDTVDLYIVTNATKSITAAQLNTILSHINDSKVNVDSVTNIRVNATLDTLFVKYKDEAIDTVPIGGATLWATSGSDIEHTNAGAVIIDSLLKIYPLPAHETVRVGRLLSIETDGTVDWVSPDLIGDTISKLSDNPLGLIRNVKAYGATGDNATDDHSAIQDAFDVGSGYIIIGESIADTFLISQPIYVTSDNYVVEINGVVKMMDGYSVDLAADADSANNYVTVAAADISKFSVGQWVSIADDNMEVQGGGTGQTRTIAVTYPIASINNAVAGDADSLVFADNIAFDFTTLANAKVGHTQSCFIFENVSNITMFGDGVIDQNKANQYDVEPVRYVLGVSKGEQVMAGCAVSVGVPPLTASFTHEIGFKIYGLTLQNSLLHNLSVRGVDSIIVSGVKFLSAHDKAYIGQYVNTAIIDNCEFKYSDYEDGISLYIGNYNYRITNCYFDDIARYGLLINSVSGNITGNNLKFKDNASAITIAADSVAISDVHINGGGVKRYTGGAIYLVDIGNVDSCYISDVYIDNAPGAAGGVLIDGTSNNIHFYGGKISNLTLAGTGRGFTIAASGGNYPSDVYIRDFHIANNLTGVYAESGVSNIKIHNCNFSSNGTDATNLAAIDYSGCTGLTKSPTANYTGMPTFKDATLQNVTYLPKTNAADTGVIFKNGARFIHDFSHPTGSTAVPVGGNTFIGQGSGNFTGGSTATTTNHGSRNTAVGYFSFQDFTTAGYNTAVGYAAMSNATTCVNNVAIGYNSLLDITTGTNATAVGSSAAANTDASNNTVVGSAALFTNISGISNTVMGYKAGFLSTGSSNILIGEEAGYNETGSSKSYWASDSTSWVNGMASGSKLLFYADQSNAAKSNHFMNIFAKVAIGEAKALSAYELEVVGDVNVTGLIKSGQGTITDNDSTPSVAGANVWVYNGTANAVSIDALDDHVVGAFYTIIGNSNTYTVTIPDGSVAGGDSFNLSAAWVGGADDVITLYCIAADTFKEVSRSDN